MKNKLIEYHENEWMLCHHEGGCKHQQELRPLDILRLVDLALFFKGVSLPIMIYSFYIFFTIEYGMQEYLINGTAPIIWIAYRFTVVIPRSYPSVCTQ